MRDRDPFRWWSIAAVSSILAGIAGYGLSMTSASQSTEMDERCRKEVLELHQFFQDWFTGKLENTPENLARFTAVVDEGFQIVSPEGGVSTREQILDRVERAHGARSALRIWIENYSSRPLAEGVQLVSYEEWQETEGQTRGRISTAVFTHASQAPNGVRWVRVHETWLP